MDSDASFHEAFRDLLEQADIRSSAKPISSIRGRLDGTARVVVIGQDPAQHENILRRVLVGEAGQRVQGFLFKMGIDRSCVIINAFLYSVKLQVETQQPVRQGN